MMKRDNKNLFARAVVRGMQDPEPETIEKAAKLALSKLRIYDLIHDQEAEMRRVAEIYRDAFVKVLAELEEDWIREDKEKGLHE
ncbi:hypothetical protein [Sulfuriroseicoccus oceanibius]|uniref:Uncharacterized protein n=1 Tax=Sulfuriroseicoccus oceanibius TaxID=2707525 RepID=A0A6B3L8L2_9BACT|nr:hypothetical protein [Sulfuriroseicoccus oceanibius]QQL44239.1 hypothetical protein G3M56_010070 [Sulfuriroseicoccus oceanibius]